MKWIIICVLAIVLLNWKTFRAIGEMISAPSYSTCGKCHRPWKYVNGYSVWFNDHEGMFAVCEECWNNSSLEELKGYYGDVQKRWATQGSDCNYNQLMDSVEAEFKRTRK